MNEDPFLYSKNCQMQRFDANYFLTTYLSQVNVKDNAAVLDVGAGDGLVTLEMLLPRLPNFKKLVVSDKSKKMVDFAKNRFHDERIETVQMDIVDYHKSFKDYFDHIFSFYCLNNVTEEKTPKAMKNIFDMLKPGGTFLATLIVNSSFFDICESMVKDNKWPKAMADYAKSFSPYRGLDNPADKLRLFLEHAGFEVQICKYEKREFIYSGLKHFLDFGLAVVPILKVDSQDERTKFVADFKETIENCNELRIENSSEGEKVHFFYSALVVCASKPVRV
ncbi:juvenile hormone acid O-methyltransferase-like [Zophobas morio]|uniref:juvenile hormone acid O-methyltransferase-like n=1 Tax=Zophobas morio TaxID=2755281 RepID=UPI003082E479